LFDLFNAVPRSVDMNKNKDIKNTVKEEIAGIFVLIKLAVWPSIIEFLLAVGVSLLYQ